MTPLLRVSALIDGLNERVGRLVYWLILAAVLVSAGNAVVRYSLDTSSNAWLELQWYLFSAVFLLAAGYTLLHNEHVRIDLVYSHLLPRRRAWIDLLGGVFFLLPMAIVIMVSVLADVRRIGGPQRSVGRRRRACCAGPSNC